MNWKSKFVLSLIALLCLTGLLLKNSGGELNVFALDGAAQGNKIHPVILIHGLGSRAEMWNETGTISHTLEADGYDMHYVRALAYPLGRGREDGYGDIRDIAEELAQEVDRLSKDTQGAQVDIIAHSLGGLITREYLKENFSDHNIGKFIDIGTPHRGTALMAAYNESMDGLADSLTDEPVENWLVRELIDMAVHQAIKRWGFNKVPDPTTPACQQLDPNSNFLKELNQSGQSPQDVDYSMIYGDVALRYRWYFFGFYVESDEAANLGDLLVARDNASTIPGLGSREGPNPTNYHTYGFPASLVLPVYLDPLSPALSVPDLGSKLDQVLDVWHSGLTHNAEVNQLILSILNEDYIEPSPEEPQPSQGDATTSATVLILDVSDSMNETWQGGLKIQSAKQAAQSVLNMIEQESQIGESQHQVAIVSFASSAYLDLGLTSNYESARSTVHGLATRDRTNIGAGMQRASQALDAAPPDAKKIVILLSDGQTNEGLSPQGILDGPVQQVTDAGACIYTVGFGDPGDLDEVLLRQIAERSDCGEYTYASAPSDLERVYVRLRHQSLGEIIGQFEGQISQDETAEVGQIEVPASQEALYVTLNWEGSTLDLVLIDPLGHQVDENTPGVSLSRHERLVYFIKPDPRPGIWRLRAIGLDVPEGTLDYEAIASVRQRVAPPSPSSNSAWIIALLLLVALGGGGAIFVYMARPSEPTQALAGLQVIQDQAAPLYIQLRRGQLTIGRASNCDVRLSDPRVSSHHAILQQTPSGYVLTDQGSTNGTYVEGRQIQQTVLRGGERLRLGHTEMVFTVVGKTAQAPQFGALAATLAVMIGQQEYGRYTVPAGAILGGHAASPVPLNADAQVSRQHARLDYQAGQWLITDLNSTNGTYVNGQIVRERVLRAGDEIQLGNTVLRFCGESSQKIA